MQYKQLRDLVFPLHRYLGLIVGLLLIVVGLTGSLLVFQEEIDHFLVNLQFGQVVPQGERVSIESVLETVRAAYGDRPDLKLEGIDMPPELDAPYAVSLESPDEKSTEVYINLYTGKILGSRQWENSLIGFTFRLHYELLAGDVGLYVVGIVALLVFILCVTGLILWPGWRKLISGFKIKWQAHIKRANFDLHKVAGVITVVFLALTAFTGFIWNFSEFTYPVVYAATFSPKPPEPVSKVIADKSPLGLAEILPKADAALPGGILTYVSLPVKPDEAFRIYKKFPQNIENYENRVYLDQYSGEILWLKDSRQPQPLGERFLDSFTPLHYGTFLGLPSRILYVFVGLAPLILFITGFVMWKYRYQGNAQIKREIRTHPRMRRLFSVKGFLIQRQAGSRKNL